MLKREHIILDKSGQFWTNLDSTCSICFFPQFLENLLWWKKKSISDKLGQVRTSLAWTNLKKVSSSKDHEKWARGQKWYKFNAECNFIERMFCFKKSFLLYLKFEIMIRRPWHPFLASKTWCRFHAVIDNVYQIFVLQATWWQFLNDERLKFLVMFTTRFEHFVKWRQHRSKSVK